MDFTQWTRQDFLDFDKRRQEVMQPTQEEIELQLEEQRKNKEDIIRNKLSNIGFVKPDIITKDFALNLLETINAKQFVGDNLEGWIDNQIILFGDIETAFDELVIRFL